MPFNSIAGEKTLLFQPDHRSTEKVCRDSYISMSHSSVIHQTIHPRCHQPVRQSQMYLQIGGQTEKRGLRRPKSRGCAVRPLTNPNLLSFKNWCIHSKTS